MLNNARVQIILMYPKMRQNKRLSTKLDRMQLIWTGVSAARSLLLWLAAGGVHALSILFPLLPAVHGDIEWHGGRMGASTINT